MQRLSSKPILFTTMTLLILGVISLVWLLGLIVWLPAPPFLSEITSADSALIVDSEQASLQGLNQSVATDSEGVVPEQSDLAETAPSDKLPDGNGIERRTLAQEYTGSMSLGEWRELQLQDTKFGQGQLVAKGADGNTLVAFFLNETKSKTAIIAIDLVSGAVQPITKILYKELPERNKQRIQNIKFANNRVVWVENMLPSDAVENPNSSDIIQELHIYDLDTATEKIVPVSGAIYPGQMHYSDNVVSWVGSIDSTSGIYAYNIGQEKFFLIDAKDWWHTPSLPYVCDSEQIIYYLEKPKNKDEEGLYLKNITTDEIIKLGVIDKAETMYNDFRLYVCDEKRAIWVATDSSDQTEYLQIYDLKKRQQESLTIPGESKIYSIKFGGNVVGTRLSRQQSIGYDLGKNEFFYVNQEPNMHIGSKGNPAEIITENYWVHIQHFDGLPRIMVAPINRDF